MLKYTYQLQDGLWGFYDRLVVAVELGAGLVILGVFVDAFLY